MEKKPSPDASEPRIHQESYGPNSPNIVGSHNQITNVLVNQERRLSMGQKVALAERMSKYTGRDGDRVVWCALGNPESLRLALDFVEAFRMAGWKLPGTGLCQGLFTVPVMGMQIEYLSDEQVPPVAADLMMCLSQFGMGGCRVPNPKIEPGDFRIIIGNRH